MDVDEIKAAFNKVSEERNPNQKAQIQVLGVEANKDMLPPGFNAAQAFYGVELRNMVRRGYRHHAGATMPTSADDLIELTSPIMVPLFLTILLRTFADGLRVGQREDQLVKMLWHFEQLDKLWENDSFLEASMHKALEFTQDIEVYAFFTEYLGGGLDYMAHVTGFAHNEVDPNKVWDLWLLLGGATSCSCYLAGYRLGNAWYERDLLAELEDDDGPE